MLDVSFAFSVCCFVIRFFSSLLFCCCIFIYCASLIAINTSNSNKLVKQNEWIVSMCIVTNTPKQIFQMKNRFSFCGWIKTERKKKSNKFAKSSLNSVRLGINFKFRSKTQIRFYRRKKSLFLSAPTIIRRIWKKSNKFKTSKIWHLLNGITIQYCFIVNAYFFATKQNTTHRKSEKNPFLRALFHVFMTYFPECHANTKKPHWCVLTEKQSTLNIFYIYNNTRSFVCFNSLALSLSLSLTLSLSHALTSSTQCDRGRCVVQIVYAFYCLPLDIILCVFISCGVLSSFMFPFQSLYPCALFGISLWVSENLSYNFALFYTPYNNIIGVE